MTTLGRMLTFAILLCTSALQAQWIHWGLDGVIGIHYNTLDAASYKTPFGGVEAGAHITLSDPYNSRQMYFNGRLTIGYDFQTYIIFPGTNLDCSFQDLVGSFQAYKKLNEKFSLYAGINLSFNTISKAWFRSGGNAFTISGQRAEVVEALIRQNIRKLNAGIEAGFMYPLGEGFNAGLHLTYYIQKRLNDGLEVGPLAAAKDVSLNFRPLALKMLCTLDLH